MMVIIMSLFSTKDTKITTGNLAELSVIAAVLFAGKELMNFIPNVHPVLLIIIAVSRVYGWGALYPVSVFVLLEMIFHGFGMWTISYLYIWPLAVCFVMIFRKNESRIFWTLFAGAFGLLFGALCTIPYLFVGGWQAAVSYWISGIPFDLIHGISNALLVFLLLGILYKTLLRLHNGK